MSERVYGPPIDAEVDGMDWQLDCLHSLLIGIAQRRMTPEQLERFALLLADAAESRRLGWGGVRTKRGRVAA